MAMKDLTDFQNTIFNYVIIISYILYFLIFFGLSTSAPEYLETLQYWTKIYVSLFLMIRFNVFRKVQFTDFDRKVAFNAGFFLLTTTLFDQIMNFLYAFKKDVPKNTKEIAETLK